MKKFTVVFLCCFIFVIGKGQHSEKRNDILKDTIVSKINRAEYEKIYEMADKGFKRAVKKEDLVGLLRGTSDMGKIHKTEKINTNEYGASLYRLFFAKKSLQLELKAISNFSYSSFGLSYYQLPVKRSRTKCLTDNALTSKLDSTVQKAVSVYMSNENVAGLSVGVLQNGEMFFYNYGETEKGNKQIPTNETIYEIGSITKTFTGILLANAVQEGRAKLNDDIRKYLAGNFPNLQFEGKAIQLLHLSNHTSRLPSQPKIVDTGKDPFDASEVFNEKTLNDILLNVRIDSAPGIKEEYSNFGVSLLGYILEKVYNQSYEQLLDKYIFKPYGMAQSRITLTEPDYKRFAQGYDVEGGITKYWRNRLAEPAGGIRSTTRDMLLYMKEQMDAKSASAAWLSHQLTFGDNNEGRGLNWRISKTKKGYLVWGHAGGTDGFSSLCLIYPELKSGIILLTNNGNHDDEAFYDIGKSIYLNWVK